MPMPSSIKKSVQQKMQQAEMQAAQKPDAKMAAEQSRRIRRNRKGRRTSSKPEFRRKRS
jgi:hypothetical protein